MPFGRSSPVLFDNRLLITASEGDRLVTLCFNRIDGQLLWRHEVKRTRITERVERLNDPASPTPAANASGVYVFFPDFGLLALDLNGRERWRVPLGPFKTAYGLASSPIVVDGIVVQVCDQQAGSFLIAVDARTGRTRWRVERPDMREGWFTPAVIRQRGRTGPWTLVVPGSARIEGIDLQTGRGIWQVTGSGAENLGVPIADDEGRLYVNARGFAQPAFPPWATERDQFDDNRDARLSREEVKANPTYHEQFSYVDVNRDGYMTEAEWTDVRNAGVGNFGLTALRLDGGSAGQPTVLWRVEKNLPYVPAPVLYKGVIYLVKNGGIVTAVNAVSGAILKETRTHDALGQYFASPVAGDDKIYLASEEGKVTVLQAGPDLRVLAVNDLGQELYSTPALMGGAVYIRTRSHLYSFREQELSR